jgi:hypothetical protein
LVPVPDIHHLGKEVVVVVVEDLVDLVGAVVVASGAEVDHVDLLVGEVQDLERLVLLVLPLCHRKDCLGRVQYPEVVKQSSGTHHQWVRPREGFLL